MKKILSLLCLLAFAFPSYAAVTFGASVTNANGTLSTTVTWNAPGASGCVASGHSSWTGNKAATGTLALPPIALSGTYTLTLVCTIPGNAPTTVLWIPSTTNTDGSALTNLASYKVVYGNSATALTQSKSFPAPASQGDMGSLAAGNWFFGVRAVNSSGVESANSAPLAQKTVTGSAVESGQPITLTVNPVPAAPSGVSVE